MSATLTFPSPTLLKNVVNPTDAQDAATKNYVDNALQGGASIGAAGSNTQVQFNNGNILGASANFTFNSSTNLLTVTGNIAATNANLGNLVTANFFTGNGSLLTGVTASSASTAGTVTNNAQSNITSLGTLTGLTINGVANLGNISNIKISGGSNTQILSTDGNGNLSFINQVSLTGYATETYVSNAVSNLINSAPTVLDTLGELSNALGNDANFSTTITSAIGNKLNTSDFSNTANSWLSAKTSLDINGNITSGNANLGNAVIANFFSGSGNNLSNIQGSNVSGQVSNALVSGTVYTNAQPNITSIGTLTSLNVTGNTSFTGSNVSLGNVSNLKITGGNANFYLKTDGSGNLSWAEVASGTSQIIVDGFTGNGSQTTFTLTTTPSNVNSTTVNYNGATLLKESYSISGANITFGSAPANGAKIEVTTITASISGSSYGNTEVANYLPTYTGNLSANVANLTTINMSGNIIPTVGNTYSLGNATNKWKSLYLESNTLYLGNTAFSESDILPFNLTIAPEVLVINTDAPFMGDDVHWLWTWQQSTLPYARATITNQMQTQVPLYRQGTYQVNNFANEIHGNMDQRHGLHLKWVDGAGFDNLVSWAVNIGNVTHSHPNINNGANTTVQRLNISVPANITIPTLNLPSNVYYNVAANGSGSYSISGSGVGENRNIGPLYRGATYTFNLDSSLANHPFYITTDNGTGFVANTYVGEYTTGVTGSRGNGAVGYNTLTFTVPQNAPDVLYYQCARHSMMRGAIAIKNLQVETNINGNPILYFQHAKEGHKTPVEIRPIPSMVNQMCLVYDATTGQFVPQDMATYVENTPSFKNKIQEVAGTATLVAPDGVAVVPTVLVVEDVSYLPIFDNNNGDIAFDQYTNTIYVWDTNAWKSTKPTSVGTVTTNAQPNITSVGTLTSLSVSGNVNLTGANITVANLANFRIPGGAANYVLKTDGTGNLSWAEQSASQGGSASLIIGRRAESSISIGVTANAINVLRRTSGNISIPVTS
jgi:hypothetical protein